MGTVAFTPPGADVVNSRVYRFPSCAFDIEELPELPGFRLTVTAKLSGQTGVEMEALTGTSIGLLTIYDMLKAIDKGMVISDVRLETKTGVKSGNYQRIDSKA